MLTKATEYVIGIFPENMKHSKKPCQT